MDSNLIAWNKIVSLYNKNYESKEEIVQSSWEQLFSFIFNYSDNEIDSQRCVQMGVNTKRADIVIKKDQKDLFVVELKRHILHDGQSQLFSYLNQLKVDLGILVCDKLYIYDYDYTKKDDNFTYLEIPFEENNEDGACFVEMFSRDNFDKEKIRDFIKKSKEEKNFEENLRNELTETLIFDLLKSHFSEKYPQIAEEKIDSLLEQNKIVINPDEKKSDINSFNTYSENGTSEIYKVHLSSSMPKYFDANSYDSKNHDQFSMNGMLTGGKGPTVLAAVQWFVRNHPEVSFSELRNCFPDVMAKPGFGKMLRKRDEISLQEWNGNRFKKNPIALSDGTVCYVTNQWKPDNMENFIRLVAKLGIEIKRV